MRNFPLKLKIMITHFTNDEKEEMNCLNRNFW